MKVGNISVGPISMLVLATLSLLLIGLSPYPLLTLFILLVLLITLQIVGFPNQPGVIFFIFFFHWLQVSFTVFTATYSGFSINKISWSSRGETAVWICGLGLIFLAFGYRFWLKKIRFPSFEALKQSAYSLNPKKVITGYVIFFFVNAFLEPIFFRFPSATQLLMRVGELKGVFIFLLVYVAFFQRKAVSITIGILFIEFILGFTGFFSEFKVVIFYLIIAFIPLIRSLKYQNLVSIGITASVLFTLAINWQAVKGDYRTYLNQGTRTQTVKVSETEALNKIQELWTVVTPEDRVMATRSFFERIAYTKYIASAMEYVPEVRAHENGNMWLRNFEFAAIPRFLNPDKGIKDDSEKVNEYTHFNVSTGSQGVSFSIGYFGDSYIDFGYAGMLPMISLIGFLIGGLFYFFYQYTKLPIIVKFSFLNVVFFGFHTFGHDGVTVAGLLTINFAYYYILYVLIMRPLSKWLAK